MLVTIDNAYQVEQSIKTAYDIYCIQERMFGSEYTQDIHLGDVAVKVYPEALHFEAFRVIHETPKYVTIRYVGQKLTARLKKDKIEYVKKVNASDMAAFYRCYTLLKRVWNVQWKYKKECYV